MKEGKEIHQVASLQACEQLLPGSATVGSNVDDRRSVCVDVGVGVDVVQRRHEHQVNNFNDCLVLNTKSATITRRQLSNQ